MNKIWTKHYDPGVPYTIDPDQYSSLGEMLEEAFQKYSTSPCFINFGEILTFKQVDQFSQAYAGFLQTHCQLNKGDRVALMMANTLQYPIALFGAFRAGFITVNLNPLLDSKQIHRILQETDAKCIIVLSDFAYIIEKAIIDTDVKHVIITETADLFSFPKRLLFYGVAHVIKKIIPPWDIEGSISFRKTINPFYQKKFKKPHLIGEDLAYLQFTEGRETGRPKCVMLTHRNLIACGLQCTAWSQHIFHELKGCVILPIPLFKLVAMSGYCLTFMRAAGLAANLITDPFNIPSFVDEIKRFSFSVIFGIRSIFQSLVSHEAFRSIDFSSLKIVLSGGAPLSESLINHWHSITQILPSQGYVLTEGSPIIAFNPISQKVFTGSVGLPLPSTEVKICNDQGEEMPFNTRGEIWVRGPQIMKGYWKKPEKTNEVLSPDGWFKTGDIATMDEKGYVYLIDRKEDVFNINEHTIYPTEIENKIIAMKGIQEVVIVKGNPQKEEYIKAYIVKTDPSLSKEAIFSYCKRHLETYQVPTKIEFRQSLPKSASGYILRHLLRIEAKNE